MFLDLALLVKEQSEMLDSIEKNLESASNYLIKGENELKQAKKWYEKSRTVNFIRKCAVY